MAFLALAFGLRLSGSNILMTLGGRAERIVLEVLAVLAMLVLLPMLAKSSGIDAVARGLVITELALAAACWLLAWRRWRRAAVSAPHHVEAP